MDWLLLSATLASLAAIGSGLYAWERSRVARYAIHARLVAIRDNVNL